MRADLVWPGGAEQIARKATQSLSLEKNLYLVLKSVIE